MEEKIQIFTKTEKTKTINIINENKVMKQYLIIV